MATITGASFQELGLKNYGCIFWQTFSFFLEICGQREAALKLASCCSFSLTTGEHLKIFSMNFFALLVYPSKYLLVKESKVDFSGPSRSSTTERWNG